MGRYIQQYVYDEVGNFLEMNHSGTNPVNPGWKRKYSYDETSLLEPATSLGPGKKNNRLTSTQIGSDPIQHYKHDAHGNMTTMPHLSLMQWDFQDQLQATSRQVVNNQPPDRVSETTYYVYDAGGERVRKVTERQNGSRKAERIYLGGFEVYREYGGDGSSVDLERETLHVMDDEQRVALVETRTTQANDGSPAQLIRYQLGNHLGSASVELNDQAKVISYEEYYPYGSTSYQAVDKAIKAVAKRYRYTGKERDEETGFSYHGARYYAGWLGRWVSCDPIDLLDGMNLFFYARGNPLNNTDKRGAQSESYQLSADPNNPKNYRSFKEFRQGVHGPWSERALRTAWKQAKRNIIDIDVIGKWQSPLIEIRGKVYPRYRSKDIQKASKAMAAHRESLTDPLVVTTVKEAVNKILAKLDKNTPEGKLSIRRLRIFGHGYQVSTQISLRGVQLGEYYPDQEQAIAREDAARQKDRVIAALKMEDKGTPRFIYINESALRRLAGRFVSGGWVEIHSCQFAESKSGEATLLGLAILWDVNVAASTGKQFPYGGLEGPEIRIATPAGEVQKRPGPKATMPGWSFSCSIENR